MSPAIDLLRELTEQGVPISRRRDLALEFSHEFGWRPHDFIESTNPLTTANLIVEHGLDSAAVLSFIPSHRSLRDLQFDERRNLLGLSYNSLVDWHVWVDRDSVEYVYNRAFPAHQTHPYSFDFGDYSSLQKAVFDQAIGRSPNPNVPALDGILLETINNWRRILRSELGNIVTNTALSGLFNALIFARAVEDYHDKVTGAEQLPTLKQVVEDPALTIAQAIEQTIVARTGSNLPQSLLNLTSLEPFKVLSHSIRTQLVESFYGHSSVPYAYDFSVISKHALSKIYERYVAAMHRDESVQFSLFPSEPEVEWNKRLGGIYTPHYIASFFARYLKAQLSQERFIEARIADPACGSGIFLRVSMEQKIASGGTNPCPPAQNALGTTMGVDTDENAVAASRLSLALLHLASCGELPQEVPILCQDALKLFARGSSHEGKFDAVMMNPPFVRTELQSLEMREAIAEHVGELVKGKRDYYLAFLALSIRALKPGGFGFFVVPHPLLTSDNLGKLRNWIKGEAWIRVIADLSAIRVFEADVYVALIIAQRKELEVLSEPPVSLIQCQRDVGLALEDFLDGKRRETSSYSMFDVSQASLDRSTWSVSSPQESGLLSKLEAMPRIKDVGVVRQGMITGSDNVFVINTTDIPDGEEVLYKPWLPDRMISRFSLPSETGLRVFYPVLNGHIVEAEQMEDEFPETWSRLLNNKEILSSRLPVQNGNLQWWRPNSPRKPEEMFAPKIVVPELFLLPRFGLDVLGRWVVSHSPFVYVSNDELDKEFLYLLLAVLNSSITSWYIDVNARKYRSQYNKLGVALLRRVPFPDLSRTSLTTLREVIDLTTNLVANSDNPEASTSLDLDNLVLRKLYRLSDEDLSLVAPQIA